MSAEAAAVSAAGPHTKSRATDDTGPGLTAVKVLFVSTLAYQFHYLYTESFANGVPGWLDPWAVSPAASSETAPETGTSKRAEVSANCIAEGPPSVPPSAAIVGPDGVLR